MKNDFCHYEMKTKFYICTVKKFVIIIALLFISKPIIPVIDYIINYDYIVKELCENKKKPELQCNGKCQLMKEMAKAAEEESANDKSNSSDKKENHKNIEILFYTEIKSLVSNQTRVKNQYTVIDNYSNLYSYKTSFSIFHPPAVVS
ncbi:hypothetical protein [Flavobacterium macrobrachii]|jgi:hypothetical protein|uniref:hypothetical protein n=1 Tax=Flavobacterium macrobrachii TaxID=591204 RepID=UPI0037C129D5